MIADFVEWLLPTVDSTGERNTLDLSEILCAGPEFVVS
jgi:hypothetical protein